jgi:hypothetical protein
MIIAAKLPGPLTDRLRPGGYRPWYCLPFRSAARSARTCGLTPGYGTACRPGLRNYFAISEDRL